MKLWISGHVLPITLALLTAFVVFAFFVAFDVMGPTGCSRPDPVKTWQCAGD